MRSIFKRKSKKKQDSSSGMLPAAEASYDWEPGTYDERDESPGTQGSKKAQNFKRGKDCNVRSRDGVPIITSEGADHFSPSAVNGQNNYAVSGFYTKQKDHSGSNRPRVRPAASKSAFGGAPRYDWMDIETTAAIRVQAAWRRARTQIHLDKAGISTPGMRNRRRKRNARNARMKSNAEDVPFPFNMCGMGLLFGDATLEDEAVIDDMERRKLRKEKEDYEMEEERKRKYRMRKKSTGLIEEEIEVIDD